MRFVYLAFFGLAANGVAQNAVPAPAADPGGAASPAAAPAPASTTPATKPVQLGPVTITGSLRARLYAWDWFAAPPAGNEYQYSGNILRLSLSERLKTWDWNAEFAVPFLLALPSNATAPAPQGALGLGSNYYSANHNTQNTAMIFPKQLYVHFRGLGGDEAHSLYIGRFTFLDGSEITPKNATLANLKASRVAQRLLGDFGWSDVGRSFDGVHYSYTKSTSDFTFVSAIPTRGVFQVDGWGWNRAAFAYGAYTKEWGKGRHAADTRFFFLDYQDWRHILKTDNRSLAARRGDLYNIQIQTFGGHSMHAFTTAAGTIDAIAWGAAQTGRWGTQTQRAFAADFEGGFQPKILPRVKPWIRGGYTYGSGDGNPNDSTHETFFQVLPTPRPYARFPFFNMMNNEDRWASLILRPHAKLTISSEFHALRLANANDLWYSGGGIYQPWSFGYTGRSTSGRRSLGNLYDTSVEYRMTRQIAWTGYFGYTQGLAAMEQIYPRGKDGKFGYLEMMYRF
ncbi:MAG: alginate export family protein [Bryobacterales bacterium]|nr:alginate export family protein [Bryobacterales bacterium]MBV9400580.1 alginate export family protein [Bryobacterales bacterium]